MHTLNMAKMTKCHLLKQIWQIPHIALFQQHFGHQDELKWKWCNEMKWCTRRDEHVCKWNAHDDMIWDAWHASNDKATIANNWKTPGTSVSGRYKSRDLEWHRRENGRDKEKVKLSCSFDKWVKPTNLEKVKLTREKNTTEINEVENTPLGKWTRKNKFEQLSGWKDMQGLIKWRTWAAGTQSG